MHPLVAVVGDATLDIHVHLVRPMRPRGDVPAGIRLEPGGQGANVAVRLARRGVGVRLVCAIGEDAGGRIVRASLAAEGVELHDLGAPSTGAVVVLLDGEGERTMLSQRVPLGERLASAALPDVEWLVVSGYALAEPDAGRRLGPEAHAGRRVLLGCSLDPRSAEAWAAAAAALRPDLTILNDSEAGMIAGDVAAPAELARRIAVRFGGLVVVSHRSGAAAAIGEQEVEVATVASPAVDTTGAGDALAAVLVAELLEADWPPDGDRMRSALTAAVAVAAEVTRVVGAQARVSGEPSGTVRP